LLGGARLALAELQDIRCLFKTTGQSVGAQRGEQKRGSLGLVQELGAPWIRERGFRPEALASK